MFFTLIFKKPAIDATAVFLKILFFCVNTDIHKDKLLHFLILCGIHNMDVCL